MIFGETETSFVANMTLANLAVNSIKQAYQEIAVAAGASTGIAPARLYKELMENESLAPSGVGNGVALPHLRLEQLEGPFVLVASLKDFVSFQAVDNQPVDIICLLLSPAHDVANHLQKLSRLSRLFRDEELLTQLRGAEDKDTMQALLLRGRARQQRAA